MPTRISLRRVGASTGKKAALPTTWAELLELATRRLGLETPAQRIFDEQGDEYDTGDIDLIKEHDVLYVSCGDEFAPSAASAVVSPPPATADAAAADAGALFSRGHTTAADVRRRSMGTDGLRLTVDEWRQQRLASHHGQQRALPERKQREDSRREAEATGVGA